eukprot:scaffold327189_cov19-Prasinocladus_malaysianus.AAC.1
MSAIDCKAAVILMPLQKALPLEATQLLVKQVGAASRAAACSPRKAAVGRGHPPVSCTRPLFVSPLAGEIEEHV